MQACALGNVSVLDVPSRRAHGVQGPIVKHVQAPLSDREGASAMRHVHSGKTLQRAAQQEGHHTLSGENPPPYVPPYVPPFIKGFRLIISDVDQCWGWVKGSALNHSSPCTNIIRARVEGWRQGPSTSANIHSKVMGSVGWTVSCMLLDVDWARR